MRTHGPRGTFNVNFRQCQLTWPSDLTWSDLGVNNFTHYLKSICNKPWRYAPRSFSYTQKKTREGGCIYPPVPTGAKVIEDRTLGGFEISADKYKSFAERNQCNTFCSVDCLQSESRSNTQGSSDYACFLLATKQRRQVSEMPHGAV